MQRLKEAASEQQSAILPFLADSQTFIMGGGSLSCLALLLVRSSRVFVDLPSWPGQAGLRELLEGLREACVTTVATHLILLWSCKAAFGKNPCR